MTPWCCGGNDHRHEMEVPGSAMRAVHPFDARDPLHECFHRLDHDRVRNWRSKCFPCCGKIDRLVRRTQQAIMADALEATGQHMQQEAPHEFARRHVYYLSAIAVGRVAHAKAHDVALHAENALIGDGNPVRVAPEVFQHLRRPAQRFFGINHPVVAAQASLEIAPCGRILHHVVPQSARRACGLQGIDELASKHAGQGMHREQETPLRTDPLFVRSQRAACHQGVDMDVSSEVLLPGMQHQREAGRTTQPAWIGGKRGERVRDRAEQQFVERARVASGQTIQIVRQGEHQVEIWHRQQLAVPRGKPCFLGARLASRAMAVAAGVQHVTQRAAMIAAFDMPAERLGAAGDNCPPCLRLGDGQLERGLVT